MEDKLVGQLARLPDGQFVRIEIVHSDGFATVRRIEGEWAGEIALCRLSSLKLEVVETILPKQGKSDDEH